MRLHKCQTTLRHTGSRTAPSLKQHQNGVSPLPKRCQDGISENARRTTPIVVPQNNHLLLLNDAKKRRYRECRTWTATRLLQGRKMNNMGRLQKKKK